MIKGTKVQFSEVEIYETQELLSQVLKSGWLTLGPFTEALENEWSKRVVRKHAIALAGDTIAQEMIFRYYGLRNGRSIIFQANMFPSPVFAAQRVGTRPRFADIDWDGMALEPQRLSDVVDVDTKAVVMMHTGGYISPHVYDVVDWCKESEILLIEDCAHATGSKMNGVEAGGFGDAGVYSLYPTKLVTGGEGGVVVTDDDDLARFLRIARNYGKETSFGPTVCVEPGYSARLSEFQAAVALVQLRHLDSFIEERARISQRYFDELAFLDFANPDGCTPNGYKCVILNRDGKTDRALLTSGMKERGIGLSAGVYEQVCWTQPTVSGRFFTPVAEDFCARHWCLPLHQSMTDDEVDKVIREVKSEFGM